MSNTLKVSRWVAAIEDRYGNTAVTCLFPSKQDLYNDLTQSLGDDGCGYEGVETGNDELESLDVEVYEVTDTFTIQIESAGIKIKELR